MMQLVEEVAFRRLDARLAALLLARSGQGTSVLRSSHQQLAEELGSVREIVTRLLGQFADEGLVVLARERIEVRDTTGLAARAV
jgi:CRP/FNR family transcriptional regulator